VTKPEKRTKQGAHLLVYYSKKVLLVVNHAIDEWKRRLSACLDAEGGHFEHYL